MDIVEMLGWTNDRMYADTIGLSRGFLESVRQSADPPADVERLEAFIFALEDLGPAPCLFEGLAQKGAEIVAEAGERFLEVLEGSALPRPAERPG